MPHANFVHLRVHSAYSLSEGAIKVEELVQLCVRERMPAVTIADTGNLFGALEFALAAAAAGVQPIIGCQLAVARDGGAAKGNGAVRARLDALVLLAQDETGYRNLCALSTKAYLETEDEAPHVTLEDIERHSAGLICLTGARDGALARLLLEGQRQAAEALLDRLAVTFPNRLYVEIGRHGLDDEQRVEPELLTLADQRGLPIVAANDCYFADAAMYEAHDALLCIAEGKQIGEADRRRLNPDFRFRSANEMRALFADLPDACDNTLAIARRCAFMPTKRNPILPAFPTEGGVSEEQALRELARIGLDARIAGLDDGAAKPYRDRLDYELDVIAKMGFPGYFLIVADFIQWSKRQGIPVGPGRGSGAGSVAAWALSITDLDPLRHGLLFERFLNPERISMPDFDIDFCQDRRDEVIRYVQEKYGQDRVAHIITFGTLQARAALRDVGRVLGMPYGYVDKICKLVPHNPAKPVKLREAIAGEAQLLAMQDEDPAVARLFDIALKLEGMYRHASTHAAGVVIGDRPLVELVPLFRDPRAPLPATQFSMKYVEAAGLVKFDFLGLKTLTVLEKTVEFIADRGEAIDLLNLPLADAKTFDMLSRGDTVGIFQLEGSGMREALRGLKPDAFEDIVALVALYRPGPMENIPRYINCKHGRERPDYLHPQLEGILKETFGVIIYQEQVMQIAQVLSGFNLGAADILRRAMGKKNKAEMASQREAFINGAVARGVDAGQAEQIFDLVDKFAGYGFNKSHAAAYALVAWQTAYLKANYAVEFMAASMSLDSGNTDKLNLFRQDLERMGIKVLPPDINRSGADFTVETLPDGTRAVRYALAAVRNVGQQAMEAVVAERAASGPFADAFEFANRVGAAGVNRRQLESLVRAGAFDALNPNRRQLFESVETLVRIAAAATAQDERQGGLFGAAPPVAVPRGGLAKIEDWPSMERLAQEFEAIGFYLSAHPLDAYARAAERLGVSPIASLSTGAVGARPRLAGVVIRKQERTSAKGNRFAFVQLSDKSGVIEVVVFSELLASAREVLEPGTAVLVTADARTDGEGLRLTAQAVERLEDAAKEAFAVLKIVVAGPASLPDLKKTLSSGARGKGRVTIVVPVNPEQEVEIALPGRYAISPDLAAAMRA
ncbi:MAG TPA: DNA polymerase III subunit alpha, partial [Alphaproteobacteria bacterium]